MVLLVLLLPDRVGRGGELHTLRSILHCERIAETLGVCIEGATC